MNDPKHNAVVGQLTKMDKSISKQKILMPGTVRSQEESSILVSTDVTDFIYGIVSSLIRIIFVRGPVALFSALKTVYEKGSGVVFPAAKTTFEEKPISDISSAVKTQLTDEIKKNIPNPAASLQTIEFKKFSRTEKSNKLCELNKDERMEIWDKLENYTKNGIIITNWGYSAPTLEIYYCVEANVKSFDEKTALKDLRVHLRPTLQQRKIQLIKLKCKPQYKPTSDPGSKVARHSDMPGVMKRVGSVGAFVNVEGKGTHVLLSGHDRTEGEELLIERSGVSLGRVKVILHGNSADHTYRDVALTELPPLSTLGSNTVVQSNHPVVLSKFTKAPQCDMKVIKFAGSDQECKQGKIRHTSFNSYDTEVGDMKNCVTIAKSCRSNRGKKRAFHSDGESGILATTLPSEDLPNEVQAMAMLVGVTTINPEGHNDKKISIAVSMDTILNDLRRDPYCNAQVEII